MQAQQRIWTPYSASRRLERLIDAAANGTTPQMMREMSELMLLLRTPAIGTA